MTFGQVPQASQGMWKAQPPDDTGAFSHSRSIVRGVQHILLLGARLPDTVAASPRRTAPEPSSLAERHEPLWCRWLRVTSL